MNIGQRVREAREALGMQRTVLARRVGVAENTIYRIETAKRTPSVELLEKIARELRTEPADLFEEEWLEADSLKARQHWERVLASVPGRQREVEAKVEELVALPAHSKADLYQVKWALDEAQDCVITLMLALPGSHRRHRRGRDVIAIDNLSEVDPDQLEELWKAESFYGRIVERLVEVGLVEMKERTGQKDEPVPVGIGA
jgi:transcriptional regulator with XRE-family HTH domain